MRAHRRFRGRELALTGRADGWIRLITIGAGMPVLIAGTVSYLPMHLLVEPQARIVAAKSRLTVGAAGGQPRRQRLRLPPPSVPAATRVAAERPKARLY